MAGSSEPTVLYIAHLPDAYGYGVTGYGTDPKHAEEMCCLEYRKQGRHGPHTGWKAQPWAKAKEWWGFSITKATAGTAHLDGCGENVELP